jgi:glycine/D-amino acid oxidase-like deaminating enzyme
MELYLGDTCWDTESKFRFEKLSDDIKTDILIIGGGITGSLSAFVLSDLGMSVTVVEKNKIGCGSSSVQTGLLMYKSDKMLYEFVDDIGEEKAVKFYKMCLEAMDHLSRVNSQLDEITEYRQRDSIYYASNVKDGDKLRREYGYLSKHGFPVEYLDREELKKRYDIDKTCALRTWHDADVDPLKLIRALTMKNLERGIRYYEHSEIDLENIHENNVHTKDGRIISFDHLVLATGYSKIYPAIKDKCSITRTYAFCSEPARDKLWKDEVMVWETKNPYLYFRATADHRIVGGGMDEELYGLEMDMKKSRAKAEGIAHEIETLFPHLDIKVSHAWNALFAKSKDGIPFIGQDPSNSSIYYLLGYEGNGTCYSMAGAMIIKDLILGNYNRYKEIVRVDRKSGRNG